MGRCTALSGFSIFGLVIVSLMAPLSGCRDRQAATEDGDVDVLRAAAWAHSEEWRLAPVPTMRIGVDVGDHEYMLSRVGGVVVLADGRVVVMNGGSGELRFFDQAGRFLRTIGRRGQGPGEFPLPFGMRLWLRGRELFVEDGNLRVHTFTDAGELIRTSILRRAEGGRVVALHAVVDDGRWLAYWYDSVGRRPQDPGTITHRKLVYTLYEPAKQQYAELFRLEGRRRYEHLFEGRTRWPFVPFDTDPLVAAARDRLFVVLSGQPTVQIRSLTGEVIKTVRIERIPVQRVADVWSRVRQEAEKDPAVDRRQLDYYSHDLPLRENLPAFAGILPGSEGRIWLQRYRLPWEAERLWDVLEPDGEWLGTVETPARFRLSYITDQVVAGVHSDELGVERVEVYQLLKGGSPPDRRHGR